MCSLAALLDGATPGPRRRCRRPGDAAPPGQYRVAERRRALWHQWLRHRWHCSRQLRRWRRRYARAERATDALSARPREAELAIGLERIDLVTSLLLGRGARLEGPAENGGQWKAETHRSTQTRTDTHDVNGPVCCFNAGRRNGRTGGVNRCKMLLLA